MGEKGVKDGGYFKDFGKELRWPSEMAPKMGCCLYFCERSVYWLF